MITNPIERDRIITAFKAAPSKQIWRGPVKRRYVENYFHGNIASVGLRTSPIENTPDLWITVNIDTAQCLYYSHTGLGGSTLQHEDVSPEIRDMVVLIVSGGRNGKNS